MTSLQVTPYDHEKIAFVLQQLIAAETTQYDVRAEQVGLHSLPQTMHIPFHRYTPSSLPLFLDQTLRQGLAILHRIFPCCIFSGSAKRFEFCSLLVASFAGSSPAFVTCTAVLFEFTMYHTRFSQLVILKFSWWRLPDDNQSIGNVAVSDRNQPRHIFWRTHHQVWHAITLRFR